MQHPLAARQLSGTHAASSRRMLGARLAPARQQRPRTVRAQAQHEPFPWKDADYAQ